MRIMVLAGTATVAVVVALLLFVTQMGSPPASADPHSPEATAAAYLEALTAERYKTAYRHSVDEFQSQIPFAEFLYARRTWAAAVKIDDYRVVGTQNAQDAVQVDVELKTAQLGTLTVPFLLVKQHNEWRVQPSVALYQQPDKLLQGASKANAAIGLP